MTTKAAKQEFVCQACGFRSAKWLGRCPECGAWNRMQEEARRTEGKRQPMTTPEAPVRLAQVDAASAERYTTQLRELDRVLGGGVVPGSLVLIGGDPGIGKSTLLLQTAFQLALAGRKVLYVSGEESAGQIKLRADRMGDAPADLWLMCETRVEAIVATAQEYRPAVLIVDSIQTLIHPEVASVPGSASQIRECGGTLMGLAKSGGPAVFLVGHVTKEGVLAGPRLLEHLVDTVVYFEGDRQHGFRILRTVKNRFGSTHEVGVFEMGGTGLKEIGDPSRLFLQERRPAVAGSAVAVSVEGNRPLLIEIQSLVSTSYFGMPQRRFSGLDYNRCSLLLAVLERRAGLGLGAQDVFISVAGGLNAAEPAVDLAVVAAVASGFKDQPLDFNTVWFGEVGLGGEIRAVPQAERRLAEAAQMGFKRCVLPRRNVEQLNQTAALELKGVDSIQEALEAMSGPQG